MKKQYFRLQLKRIFKIFPAVLLIIVITFGCLGVAGGLMMQSSGNDEAQNKKYTIGVVGNLEDSFMNIGLQALQNMDSSRFYVELKPYTEEDAVEALKKYEIIGYLQVPENYIRDLYQGRNNPAKYVTLNGPENIGSMFSEEIVKIVSQLVVQSQYGMYSMQNLTRMFDDLEGFYHNTDDLMVIYMKHILERNMCYETVSLGIADALSLEGYYLCGIITLFLLLWGIACNRIFSSKNSDYNKLLKISGVSPATQVLCEYGSYAIVSILMTLLFAVVLGIVIPFVNIPVPELNNVGVFECIGFVAKMMPVILMFTMMQYALYELIPNFIGAVLTQFLTCILLGYLSGCFYPNYFFPDTLRAVMEVLPVGLGFSYLRNIMSSELTITDFLGVMAYASGFFLLAVKMRNYRITGDLK